MNLPIDQLFCGDAVELSRDKFPDCSIHAIVTDPPYGLEFMGEEWDTFEPARLKQRWAGTKRKFKMREPSSDFNKRIGQFHGFPKKNPKCKICGHYKWSGTPCKCEEPDWDRRLDKFPRVYQEWTTSWAKEALRVLKPGASMLVMGGTRTYHRMVCGVEDAGFIIKDCLAWCYNCLSEDTEIFIRGEWEQYSRAKKGDMVLCFSKENGELKYAPIEEVFVYDFDGELIRIHSTKTDQLVTPNHNCILWSEGKPQFKQANSLEPKILVPVLEAMPSLRGAIPNAQLHASTKEQSLLEGVPQQVRFDEEPWHAQTIGATSDGKIDLPRLREGVLAPSCVGKKVESKLLLKGMQRKGQNIESTSGVENDEIQNLDGGAQGKATPEDDGRKELGLERGRDLLQDSRQLCGGEIHPLPEGVYRDGSEGRLCNGTQAIGCEGDWSPTQKIGGCSPHRPRPDQQQLKQLGVVGKQPTAQEARGQKQFEIKTTLAAKSTVKYKGKVWCVKVPTGAFVARRNGQIFITGNSGFPKAQDLGKMIDRRNERTIEDFKELGVYLKKQRESKSLGQKDIAKHFPSKTGGLTGCVWNWEHGSNVPTQKEWDILKPLLQLDNRFDTLIQREGAKREIIGLNPSARPNWKTHKITTYHLHSDREKYLTASATDLAHKWDGWKVGGLKPAYEPVLWAVKPPEGSYIDNVLKHGVGAVNVDGCRIPYEKGDEPIGGVYSANIPSKDSSLNWSKQKGKYDGTEHITSEVGRYPANMIRTDRFHDGYDRFYFVPKASRAERDEGLNELSEQIVNKMGSFGDQSKYKCPDGAHRKGDKGSAKLRNIHPTVKPVALMEHLIKLVTRKGQIVLDPFVGSGTTCIAARKLLRHYIGFDNNPEYIEIAKHRLAAIPKPLEAYGDAK